MARAKCLVTIDGALVLSSDETGRRYVFTRGERELEIDDCDVEQFRSVVKTVSERGCCGGTGASNVTVVVFEVTEV